MVKSIQKTKISTKNVSKKATILGLIIDDD